MAGTREEHIEGSVDTKTAEDPKTTEVLNNVASLLFDFSENFDVVTTSGEETSELDFQIPAEVPTTITKIFSAVYRGQVEVLRPIINQGLPADPEYVDSKEIEFKKKYGAHYELAIDIKFAEEKLNSVKDAHRRGVGHLAYNVKVLDTLLTICRQYQSFLIEKDEHGDTPLHTFCCRNENDADEDWQRKKELVKYFLGDEDVRIGEHYYRAINLDYKIDIDALNNSGESPIFNAVRSECLETVQNLLEERVREDCENEKGAKVNIKNICQNSLLHVACEVGNIAIVREFLQNFDQMGFNIKENMLNQDNMTPLDIAAELGFTAIVDELLRHEDYMRTEECLENKDHKSIKLMHRLAKHEDIKHLEILDAILNQKDFIANGVNSQDSRTGNTALHIAAGLGLEFMVEALTDSHNADLTINNALGEIPVFVACREDKEDIVQILFQKLRKAMEYTNNAGLNPFQVAVKHGKNNVVKILLKIMLEKYRLTSGALKGDRKRRRSGRFNVNIKLDTGDEKNKTSLQLAAEGGRSDVLKTILDTLSHYKIDFQPPNYAPLQSPLELAYEKGDDRTAEVFLGSRFSRLTLINLILQQNQNNIKGILKKYYDKKCCGEKNGNVADFFESEFGIFKKHVAKLSARTVTSNGSNSRETLSSSFSPRTTIDDVDSSVDESESDDTTSGDIDKPPAEIQKDYIDSLSAAIAHLEHNFKSVSVGEQLTRMFLLFKLEHLVIYIHRPTEYDAKTKEASYTAEQKLKYIETIFNEIQPFIRDQQTRSVFKIVGVAMIGMVLSALFVGLGIGLGLAIAPWLTTIYALISGAASATILSVAGYYAWFKNTPSNQRFFTELKNNAISEVSHAHQIDNSDLSKPVIEKT